MLIFFSEFHRLPAYISGLNGELSIAVNSSSHYFLSSSNNAEYLAKWQYIHSCVISVTQPGFAPGSLNSMTYQNGSRALNSFGHSIWVGIKMLLCTYYFGQMKSGGVRGMEKKVLNL